MHWNRKLDIVLLSSGLALTLLLVCGLTGCILVTGPVEFRKMSETEEELELRETIARLEKELDRCKQLLNEMGAEHQHQEDLRREGKELEGKRDCVPSDLEKVSLIEASVLRVNHDLKYVMLSAGRDAGVRKGMLFFLFHGDTCIGTVQVDSVYPRACSASMLTRGMAPETGDRATTRLKIPHEGKEID